MDFAGTVDESSDLSGTRYQPGDAVYGHVLPSHHILTGRGALCEFVAVSPRWIDKKPDKLSFVEAAALSTAGISAYKLLQHVPPYANVFVNGGSGGVGTILLQMLKQVKHARVVSTASQDSRDLVLDRLHADEVIDHRTVGPLAAHLLERYPQRFDVCIDLIGDMRLYTSSPGFLKPSGTYIAFGGGLESRSLLHLLKWLVEALLVGYWPACLGKTVKRHERGQLKPVAGGCLSKFRFVAVVSEDDTVNGLLAISAMVDRSAYTAVTVPCMKFLNDFDFQNCLNRSSILSTPSTMFNKRISSYFRT